MKPHVLVVTAWAYPGRPRSESPLVASCARFDVPLLVLQEGEPYVHSYHNKVERFFPAVRDLDFDVLVWIDADDAFLTRDPRPAAVQALQDVGTDFLMGAEVLLWPWPEKLGPYFPQVARCSYPNAGVWAATRAGFLREFSGMMAYAANDTEHHEEGGRHLRNEDQALFQAWMTLGGGRIALDTREDLVLNLPRLEVSEQAFFLDLVNGRLPAIVHGPGIAKGLVRSLWNTRQRMLDLHREPRYDFPVDASELLRAINSTAGLAALLADLPPLESVVEVGCFRGVSTEMLALFARQVFAVDVWPDAGIFEAFRTRLAGYAHVEALRTTSVEAARNFPPRSLDLVYIDADHSYDAVRADIDAWLPRVRDGGFLTGHDYAAEVPMLQGLVAAVDERFGRPHRLYPDRSWLVQVRHPTG